MPLNTLRLNYQLSSHPNERIVFIKPIPRPPSEIDDYNRAETVLKAIAAQCLPIMKDHHLSVTTLEEYEPNPEFIGRNFNNGEIIQLVIKSKSGAWLPLNMVQMVMMHELAHNTHMNHGKGFWQARNRYANEMRHLWSKRYTGDGLWGRGRSLRDVQDSLGGNIVKSEELADLPLCGGTFRSRRRKRKAKQGSESTWKEKRDKRIEKKFGKNGTALGEDEDKRLSLEISGKGPIGGKPRVAQSKRGRELRAAAALARFGTNEKEVAEVEAAKKESRDETESEYEELDAVQEDAKYPNGRKIVDSKGYGMVRVCSEEDENEAEVKQEMAELADLDQVPTFSAARLEKNTKGKEFDAIFHTDVSHPSPGETISPAHTTTTSPPPPSADTSAESVLLPDLPLNASTTRDQDIGCSVCSMSNDALRSTCIVCGHVVDVRKDTGHWRCTERACKDSLYINSGDYGICRICGAKRLDAQQTKLQKANCSSVSDAYSGHIAYL